MYINRVPSLLCLHLGEGCPHPWGIPCLKLPCTNQKDPAFGHGTVMPAGRGVMSARLFVSPLQEVVFDLGVSPRSLVREDEVGTRDPQLSLSDISP